MCEVTSEVTQVCEVTSNILLIMLRVFITMVNKEDKLLTETLFNQPNFKT